MNEIYKGLELGEVNKTVSKVASKHDVKQVMKNLVCVHAAVHKMRVHIGLVKGQFLFWMVNSPENKKDDCMTFLPVFVNDTKNCPKVLPSDFEEITSERMFITPNKEPYFIKFKFDEIYVYKINAFLSSEWLLNYYKMRGINALNAYPVRLIAHDTPKKIFYGWRLIYKSRDKKKKIALLPLYSRDIKKKVFVTYERLEKNETVVIRNKSFVIHCENFIWNYG